jgi:hypothetical protein
MIKKRKLLGIPLARRQTRRLLVIGYWTVALSLVLVVSLLTGRDGTVFGLPFISLLYLSVLLMVGLLGGDGKRGAVRAFEGRTSEGQVAADYTYMTPEDIAERKRREIEIRLDERDVNLRNTAHYKAYSALRWIIFLVFVFTAFPLPREPFFLRPFLLSTLFLVVWSLPQTIILWTEPDMEADSEEPGA